MIYVVASFGKAKDAESLHSLSCFPFREARSVSLAPHPCGENSGRTVYNWMPIGPSPRM